MYIIHYDICNRWVDERNQIEFAQDDEELADLLSVLNSEGGFNYRVERAENAAQIA